MIYQLWGSSPVAVAHLSGSATISIFAQRFEYLPDVKGLNCQGEDMRIYTSCLRKELNKVIDEQNFPCLPTQFKILKNDMKEVIKVQ